MKQISCEFADQDLAEQAVHSLRQHGYAIKEESLEAKEYQAKTPPVAMAGQLMTFPSQPVPDGFVILHSENKAGTSCTGLYASPILSGRSGQSDPQPATELGRLRHIYPVNRHIQAVRFIYISQRSPQRTKNARRRPYTSRAEWRIKMERYLPEGCLWNTVENTASLKSTASLQESWREGRVLEGRVTLCDSGHNLIVDLISMKGIIPKEEGAIGIQDGSTKDIALISRVNKVVCFRILRFDRGPNGEPIAILSRRQVQEECMERYVKKLHPGDIIPVRVTLGAFRRFCRCGMRHSLPYSD